MEEQFYTILTDAGKAKLANAAALNQEVNLKTIALGDGQGSYYNPTEFQTTLRGEVWRNDLSQVKVDEDNPSWIVLEGVVPSSVGGFTIREIGIFDIAGDLIAIGKYPETYKPLVENGSLKDLYIRMIIEVGNASSVTLKIDPSVILASVKNVNDLAGVGRIDETVKKNADDIKSLGAEVTSHLAEKADKLQEPWIGGVLQNGWSTTSAGIKYAKNDLSVVTLYFRVRAGTIAPGTIISSLPQGYKPINDVVFSVSRLDNGKATGELVSIDFDGNIRVGHATPFVTGGDYAGSVSYYER